MAEEVTVEVVTSEEAAEVATSEAVAEVAEVAVDLEAEGEVCGIQVMTEMKHFLLNL